MSTHQPVVDAKQEWQFARRVEVAKSSKHDVNPSQLDDARPNGAFRRSSEDTSLAEAILAARPSSLTDVTLLNFFEVARAAFFLKCTKHEVARAVLVH